MLKAILMVTLLSLNLQETENAYTWFLNYQVVERGTVSESLSASWGAETVTRHDYLIMQPESNNQVFLRFIEDQRAGDYQPMRQEGCPGGLQW